MKLLEYIPLTSTLIFGSDFETTPYEQFLIEKQTRVWLGYIESLYTSHKNMGLEIKEYINYILNFNVNTITYLHNMSGFDGEFIIWYLKDVFEYTNDKYNNTKKDVGHRYKNKQNDIHYIIIGKNGIKHEIRCSLKLIPVSIDELSHYTPYKIKKTFNYDYKKIHNEKKISEVLLSEILYIINDVKIQIYILKKIDKLIGIKKMTIASLCYDDGCNNNTPDNFRNMKGLDKILSFDESLLLHKYYQGPITILNEKFKNKNIYSKIYAKDVNSLYPYTMLDWTARTDYKKCDKKLFECNHYSLFEVIIRKAKIKENYIPFICEPGFNLKSNPLSEIKTPKKYYGTNFDLKSFIKYYDFDQKDISVIKYRCYNIAYKGFNNYINYGYNIKQKTDKNDGLYMFSKLMLNSLYGKFGTKINRPIKLFEKELPKNMINTLNGKKYKLPYRNYENYYEYNEVLTDEEYKEKYNPYNIKYKPIAIFTTAKARYITLKTIQKNKEGFIYSDTDSIYSLNEIDTNNKNDEKKIGNGKSEGIKHADGTYYLGGKFLNKKQYILIKKYTNEFYDMELEIKVASMSKSKHSKVKGNNFNYNNKGLDGKIVKKMVKGGVILVETEFTLKEK